ncbi:TIGR03668 family PPOX class F420-dependent oxidoreductase [Phytoactinopolyspora halotolerans]|uniref:TIGR03668 family PPOX class F420-dependent oxidoreductase n=1 Tax=Phytoactinopolyspora halotolerans TaxID=1981512 RepID=UPI001C2040F7|nr:TIGR03668 family PPOX class F420-dependent oxidoreductase [Phytoactinopolyspora halotolerans]
MGRLDIAECRRRVTTSRVARLATTGADQRPHLVPVTFALDEERLVVGIDQKPKSTMKLRRLRNIAENPQVAVLCDEYDEDWTQLWWVRMDGRAAVVEDGPVREHAIQLLVAKYPQYSDDAAPRGPVIVVDVERWSGWAYAA